MNCAKKFTTHNETALITRRDALVMTVGALLSSGAMAQDFPQKAVQLVVPYPPGGLTDNIARIYANSLKDSWGQAVVVDNKPSCSKRCHTSQQIWCRWHWLPRLPMFYMFTRPFQP